MEAKKSSGISNKNTTSGLTCRFNLHVSCIHWCTVDAPLFWLCYVAPTYIKQSFAVLFFVLLSRADSNAGIQSSKPYNFLSTLNLKKLYTSEYHLLMGMDSLIPGITHLCQSANMHPNLVASLCKQTLPAMH